MRRFERQKKSSYSFLVAVPSWQIYAEASRIHGSAKQWEPGNSNTQASPRLPIVESSHMSLISHFCSSSSLSSTLSSIPPPLSSSSSSPPSFRPLYFLTPDAFQTIRNSTSTNLRFVAQQHIIIFHSTDSMHWHDSLELYKTPSPNSLSFEGSSPNSTHPPHPYSLIIPSHSTLTRTNSKPRFP